MQAAEVSEADVAASLRRIVESQTFAGSERLRTFLIFVVDQTLAGRADTLKETVIGTVVFRRSPGYDNKSDTVVRAAARRLRLKLDEYYAQEGAQDPVRILLTAGTYVPVFLPQTLSPGIPDPRTTFPAPPEEVPFAVPGIQIVPPKAVSTAAHRPRLPWLLLAAILGLCLLCGCLLLLLRPEQRRNMPWHSEPLTMGSGTQAFPALSPDGQAVAFNWALPREKHSDVYVEDVRSHALRRLTNGPGDNVRPTWSPDGQTVAYVEVSPSGQRTVYTVPASGGPRRPVIALSGGPLWLCMLPRLSWSPDGTQLASAERVGADQACGIVLIDLRYGTKRVLSRPSPGALADVEPAFSPDGRFVAFMREATASSDSDLYVIPTAGGEARAITRDHAELRGPTWTPDGTALIAASSRDTGFINLWRFPLLPGNPVKTTPPEKLTEGPVNLGFPSMGKLDNRLAYVAYHSDLNIWRLPLDGPPAGQTLRERPGQLIIEAPGEDAYPRYSPDGNQIAFISNRTGGATNLWIAAATGRDPLQLTSFRNTPVGSPAWSPDGKTLAFDLQQKGEAQIWTIGAQPGQTPRQLTSEGGNNVLPCWSPDGRFVYFGSFRAGVWHLYRVPAAGGAAVQVTPTPGQRAQISPDGQWLYFAPADGGEIRRLSLNGDARDETVLPASLGITSTDWTVGKAGVYFLVPAEDGGENDGYSIQLYDPRTKRFSVLGHTLKAAQDLSLAPDAKSLLYSQLDGSGSDILLLER